MQFQFKRPTTSKSTSHIPIRTFRQISPGFKNQPQQSGPSQASSSTTKWELAAQKINKQMFYHRMMNSNSQPFKLLTRLGGRTFKSQPKEGSRDNQNRTRIRITSKEKHNKQLFRQNKQIRISGQIISETKVEGKLKKKKRGDNFRAMPLERQLKIANIFYENPVVKIGYNMQYDSYLRLEHISQIKPNHGASICKNSIIYFLKDAPFSPNIISEKNELLPISLSIFPEFFDSKLSVSHKKRNVYLQHMMKEMNNTYDPERMAQIPRYSSYPPFKEQQYFNTVKQLISSSQENYPSHLLEGIAKQVHIEFNPFTFKMFVAEQWELWSLGNAMSSLDYVLKDPNTAKKLDIAPYLPTRIISSWKVLYHGGYSKSIYQSWNNYVELGRKKLTSKINKYHNTIQSIHGWYHQFEDLLLIEPYFIPLLGKTVTISLFKSLQLTKIKHASSVLEQIWFRGVLTLFHYGRYLQQSKKQFKDLVDYKKLIAKYIGQANKRASQLISLEDKNNFYTTSYQNFIHSLRKDAQIDCIQDLKFCNNVKQSNPCDLKNIEVLLNIQLANSIQQSLIQFKKQIIESSEPLIKLTLIIDRQTIKILEQEDQIVNTFLSIISSILNTHISGFRLKTNFSIPKINQKSNDIAAIVRQSFAETEAERRPIKQYPQIISDMRSSEDSEQLLLSYKTAFIFDKDIKQLVETVKDYYRECYSILGQFDAYLPFIKLTTTQKLFGDNEDQAESSFLKNIKLIARYKQTIKSLQYNVKVNLFEVDCTIPIKALEERINQIQYIIEQNYINIIHERIQGMDSQLNSFKIQIYDINIVLGSKQSQQKLQCLKAKMQALKIKSKRIAQMVMFCLDNKRKIESIISAYCQLVSKKKDIQKQLDQLVINIQLKRPELQSQQEQKIVKTFKNIDQTLIDLCEAESMPFQIANINEYLSSLQKIQNKLALLQKEIIHFEQWAPRSSIRSDFDELIKKFQRQRDRFNLIQYYWQQFYNFTCYYREIAKIQAKKLKFYQFKNRIEAGENAITKVKKIEENWKINTQDKIIWKPVIHHTHQYYSQKFQTDLNLCRKIEPYLQILTNNKIRDRHWGQYCLEQFKLMTIRELCRLEHRYKWEQLSTMNIQVNFEDEIYKQYSQIEKDVRSHCLLIVDLNGSDVLSLKNITECLQFLHNVQIDIKTLKNKDINGYYSGQLQDLEHIILITQQKLGQWLQIEQKYIKYLNYHIINEDQETSLFQNILELHRKLIKSYDIDNSILFISKNIVMDTYLSQIQEQLIELERRLEYSFGNIRKEYPRLYILSDEQLLQFMSNKADIEHYLKKLFPQIKKFHINQGSIEKIGQCHELKLIQPLYYQQIAGRVYKWVSALEQSIKGRVRQYYKTGLLLTQGKNDHSEDMDFFEKRPLQLSLLEQCLNFTQAVSEKGHQGLMPFVIKDLTQKIQTISKQSRQVSKILLLMLLKSWAQRLSRNQPGSFEWDRIPQFSNRNSIFEPRITILGQTYLYGFNYLQDCQLYYSDYVLTGNCLVGQSQIGKKSIIKNYAYLCGQDLLVLNPSSLQVHSNSTSLLLNYFKVLVYSGSWLFLRRIDLLDEQQLILIAECLISIRDGINQQKSKIYLNGQQIFLNKNARLFMSIQSLTEFQLPARLVSSIRPIWISAPDKKILLSIYLQSKCISSSQIGKLLTFLGYVDRNDDLRFDVISWLRNIKDPDVFLGNNFIQVIAEKGVFKSYQCQSLLQNIRYEQASLSGKYLSKEKINISIQINSHQNIAIYGPPGCGKTKYIIGLLNENYLFLNNESCLSTQQFYRYIKGIKMLVKDGNTPLYLLLKNSLAYWSLIQDNLTNYRTIMIEQDLAQLHPGLIDDIKMIDYNRIIRQKNQLKNCLVMQLMLPHVVSYKHLELDIFQLLTNPNSILVKVFTKIEAILLQSQYQNSSPYQLAIQFLQLLQRMIEAGYNPALAFIYCIIWTYVFVIEEKRLEDIFKQISMPEASTSKVKLTHLPSQPVNRIVAKLKIQEHLINVLRQIFNDKAGLLTEMIPLKNGRLVTIAEAQHLMGLVVHCEIFPNQKVNFKSSLIYNLGLMRQLYPDNIHIDTKDWLTTFLTSSTPNSRYCNFARKQPFVIFNELFANTKKKGYLFSLKNLNIIVDDLHLTHPSSLGRLKDLFQYGFTLLEKNENVHIYKVQNIVWTLGSKMGYPYFPKCLTIRIGELLLTTIFNEYIQGYCEEHLVLDRSVFSLLNLSSNITRIYKELQENEYYWFKNPLIMLQKIKSSTLTQLIINYFEYMIQILPEEAVPLQVQKNMLDLNPPKVSVIKSENEDDEISSNSISSQRQLIENKKQNNIVEILLSDNEILEQIQAKQIEPIYFEKFIRNYFTPDVINHTKKIYQRLQYHNIVILYEHAHPVYRIVKYAVKLFKKELYQFMVNGQYPENVVIILELNKANQQSLQALQQFIKGSKKKPQLKFVLLAQIDSAQTQKIYNEFPFLKSYFLNLVMPAFSPVIIEPKSQTQINIPNIIEQNWENNRQIQTLEQLISQKGLDNNFRQEFQKVYEIIRKKQLGKFQFYRKITSQMVLCIEKISKALNETPNQLSNLRERQTTIKVNKRRIIQNQKQTKAKIDHWQMQFHKLEKIIQFRNQQYNQSLQKLIQSSQMLHTKMEKIEKRIQNQDNIEYIRLKNNLKNNESAVVVVNLHQTLNFLFQKNQNVLHKVNHTLNALNSSSSLASFLNSIRKRQDYQTSGQDSIRISTCMSISRIKFLMGKMEEIENSVKKYQKISSIYKIIVSWLSIFNSLAILLGQYYQKQEQIESKIINDLRDLFGQNTSLQQLLSMSKQIQQLHIQSKRNLLQSQQQLFILDDQILQKQKEDKKLEGLEKFYEERLQRLQRISEHLRVSQYMKKVSSGVSFYFKHLEHIVFARALSRVSLTEHQLSEINDIQLLRGIFTFREELYLLRQKTGSNGPLRQLQILLMLFQQPVKALSFVEDKQNLFKSKMVILAEKKSYHVKKFTTSDYDHIISWINTKKNQNEKFLVLHENIHYLEFHRKNNQRSFHLFAEKLSKLLKQNSNLRIVYVTNYLPPLSQQFYSVTTSGKIYVSRQRLFCDLCQAFEIIIPKEHERDNKFKKQRNDIETVIKEKNSKIKQILSNIQVLSNSLTCQNWLDVFENGKINVQKDSCELLQNNFENLQTLQNQLENLDKINHNFYYLPSTSWPQLQKQLDRYFLLFRLTDHLNNNTNNQITQSYELYNDWNNILKQFRQEKMVLFTRSDYRPIINEISVNQEGVQQKSKQENKQEKQTDNNQGIKIDLVINTNFRKHNLEIYNQLAEKIIKGASWIDRASLVKYTLGVVSILTLNRCGFNSQQILGFIFCKESITQQQISAVCQKILQSSGCHQYTLTSYLGIDLILELNRLVSSGQNVLHLEAAIFLGLYYQISINSSLATDPNFVQNFRNILNQKGTFSYRYSPLRLAYSVLLTGQVAIRLADGLSLSLNLQARKGQRQRLITIIEQQRYLLNELVSVLKVKALSRKRQLVILLVDISKKQVTIQHLKNMYQSTNKYWVYLANVTTQGNPHYLDIFLQQIIEEIHKLPINNSFRIFLIGSSQGQSQNLFYNKFQVSRFKSNHFINDQQYYTSVNKLTLDRIIAQEVKRGKKKEQLNQNLGLMLIQQLIVSTITQDHKVFQERLQGVLLFFRKINKKYKLFKKQDARIIYKKLVEQILQLGYFEEQNDNNFCQFIADFFGCLPEINENTVRHQIEAQNQLSKEGLCSTIILKPQQMSMVGQYVNLGDLERINLQKIEQYLKNISFQFGEMLKRQIVTNNRLLILKNAAQELKKRSQIPTKAAGQSWRNYCMLFGAEVRNPNLRIIKQKLPLQQFLSNIKLKQICTNKKVEISTSQVFYTFLAAYQFKLARQFMQRQVNPDDLRYSSVQFGNYIHTRDYLSKMKVYLVDEQTYQQIPFQEDTVRHFLEQNNQLQGRFVLAIRKAGMLKMSQWIAEQDHVTNILNNYSCSLCFESELVLQLSLK